MRNQALVRLEAALREAADAVAELRSDSHGEPARPLAKARPITKLDEQRARKALQRKGIVP